MTSILKLDVTLRLAVENNTYISLGVSDLVFFRQSDSLMVGFREKMVRQSLEEEMVGLVKGKVEI